jgi:gamma-glutamyltranspeptidase/glutathione hydrolase
MAAGSQQTAATGAAILERGGNAVDAAVAAAFVSFMSEIGVVHLGGSGVAQIYDPHTQQSVVYDFFSAMPGRGNGRPNHELDFNEVTIDFGATTQSFHLGRGSVAVPGNVYGLCALAADYGRLPLATLLEPAIALAENGVVLDEFQANTCELLRPLYTHTAGMRQIFTPQGHMLRGGERLFVPHLAESLRELAVAGGSWMRSGRLAQALVSDQLAYGGLLTTADLAEYEVRRMPPIRICYRDYDVLLPPPCSSGGVLTAFTLKLLSHYDVQRRPYGSAAHLQLLYEVMAATSRARPVWERMADEDETGAVAAFLADDFVAEYVAQVQAAITGRQPAVSLVEESGPANTTHLSVIDSDGMAVSMTTTAGESAGYVVPGTGFIPNNILGEEDVNPRGFHNWTAGQRIATMMTPMFVTQEGHIRLVVGSGGSVRIRSAVLQVLSNLLDYRMTLNEAVNRPRVHVENMALQCEWGIDPEAMDELESWGYPVNRWPTRSIYFGGAHSVSRTPEGRLVPAGDNRRGGAVAMVNRK